MISAAIAHKSESQRLMTSPGERPHDGRHLTLDTYSMGFFVHLYP